MLVMSLITFILFGVDKWKAVHQRWRVPEATLLWCSFLMGGLGGLLGMFTFHHKIRKTKFRVLVPLFTLMQLAIFGYIAWKGWLKL